MTYTITKKNRYEFIKSFLYLSAISSVMIVLLFSNNDIELRNTEEIVNYLSNITLIPNTVTSVILGTRLFDTIGEVTVFTIAGLGVKILLAHEKSENSLTAINDPTIISLLDFAALLSSFLCFELAIRGHLSPGGGFASGVAGATAITLLMITGRLKKLENIYFNYQIISLEKIAVIAFIILSLISFASNGNMISFINIPQNLLIPILNIVCALKVTFGTWSIIRLFIIKRGIL